MGKLTGKVAIITGGSAGIGRGLALGMAREGADVVITARHEDKLQEAAEEIRVLGANVLAIKSDVTVMVDIQDMVDRTREKFGRIDILVNNVGVGIFGSFLEKDEATFDQVVATNFKGTFFCTQAVAREMVKRKYGRIINIGSAHARVGVPMLADYAGTKGAIISMTRSIAAELTPLGITINTITCGLTATEKIKNNTSEEINWFVGTIPCRRLGEPEDYVGMAVLLASDEGSFITGQSISVDGGFSMP